MSALGVLKKERKQKPKVGGISVYKLYRYLSVFPGIHTILGHTHIPSGRRLSSLPHICNRPPMSLSPPADELFTARRRAFHFVVSFCVTIF